MVVGQQSPDTAKPSKNILGLNSESTQNCYEETPSLGIP